MPGIRGRLLTPVIGSGYCVVTGVNRATPAVIRVLSISACGIANDNHNCGSTESGTPAALRFDPPLNLHLANPSDTNGKCRVVKDVSGNTFTLRACDGTTNLANNGVYSFGGQIAKGQFRTLSSLPSVYFDPALVACLTSTSAGGCAESSRAEYIALQSSIAKCPDLSVVQQDFHGSCTLAYALGWWAEGKPESSINRTRMIAGIMNNLPNPVAASDGSRDHKSGNIIASSYGDYTYEVYAPSFIKSLALAWSALTSKDRQTIEHYYMDDFDYTKGGHDYDGSKKGYGSYRTIPAGSTISYSGPGATTITGTRTDFASSDVGKLILLGFNTGGYARYFSISSVNAGAQTLTIGREIDSDLSGFSGSYAIADPWPDDGTNAGHFGRAMLNNYGMLCGSYPSAIACPDYGSGAGGTNLDQGNNHQVGRVSYHMLTALVLAATDLSSRQNGWLLTPCSSGITSCGPGR